MGKGTGRIFVRGTVALASLLLATVGLYAQDYGLSVPSATNLSCDGKGNAATNVRTYTPMFSWQFTDRIADDAQIMYHIKVGTTPGGSGMWDVTRASATSTAMYGGLPLAPNTTYYWAVQVWDKALNESAFTQASFAILDIFLRVYDGTSTVNIAADLSTDPVSDANRLRISKGGQNYSIVLVDPSAHDASKLRIQVPSGTKALGAMVTPPPAIGLSGGNMDWIGVFGGPNPYAYGVGVSNVGGGTLDKLSATVSYGPGGSDWLTTSFVNDNTTAPAQLILKASQAALSAGTYRATVVVASEKAANSPQNLDIIFKVVPPPTMSLSPNTLSFSGVSTRANPPSQTVKVSNVGAGDIMYLSATVSYGSGSGWLTASLDQDFAEATLTVTANPAALSAGTYTATVAVASLQYGVSPQNVSVTFTVRPLRRVAYVYATDLVLANMYKKVFESGDGDWIVTFVSMESLVGFDFSPFDLIAIGDGTGAFDNWGTTLQVQAIDGSGKRIVGFGNAGYAFFGKLGLAISSGNVWEGGLGAMFVVDPASTLYTTPYAVSIPSGNIIQLYEMGLWETVGIYLPTIPADVLVIGRETSVGDTYLDHYDICKQGRYLLWGYSAPAENLSLSGRKLLLNILYYMVH